MNLARELCNWYLEEAEMGESSVESFRSDLARYVGGHLLLSQHSGKSKC